VWEEEVALDDEEEEDRWWWWVGKVERRMGNEGGSFSFSYSLSEYRVGDRGEVARVGRVEEEKEVKMVVVVGNSRLVVDSIVG